MENKIEKNSAEQKSCLSYNLNNPVLTKRVFILQKSELEKRWDPNTYHFERRSIIDALKKSSHKLEPLKFVSSFKKNIVKEIPENLPYLGLENIESNTGSYISTSDKESISSAIEFKKGQVLFPKLRPYLNKVYFAEFDGVCSTEFHVLNSNKVSNEYLANFLRTNLIVNQTKYLMSGNTLPRLQTDDIESLLIPILSTENEEKVNSIMRSVFLQKQTNEAEASTLLASIDDYLLGELGITLPTPPENTLKNRMFIRTFKNITESRLDPFYHQTKFTETLNAIKKSKYKNDLIQHLIIDLKNGIEVREYVESGIRYLRVTDLTQNGINNKSPKYVSSDNEIPNRIKLNNDCVLISRSGSLGLVNIVNEETINAILSSHIFKLELNTNLVLPIFMEAFLRSSIGQIQIFRNNNGGVIPEINQDALKSIIVIVPPLSKQKEIAEHITNIRNQAQALKDQTNHLLKKASEAIEAILLN